MALYEVKADYLHVGTDITFANKGTDTEGDPDATTKFLDVPLFDTFSVIAEENVIDLMRTTSSLPVDRLHTGMNLTIEGNFEDPGDETKLGYLLTLTTGGADTVAASKLNIAITADTVIVKSKYNALAKIPEYGGASVTYRYYEFTNMTFVWRLERSINVDGVAYFPFTLQGTKDTVFDIHTEETS